MDITSPVMTRDPITINASSILDRRSPKSHQVWMPMPREQTANLSALFIGPPPALSRAVLNVRSNQSAVAGPMAASIQNTKPENRDGRSSTPPGNSKSNTNQLSSGLELICAGRLACYRRSHWLLPNWVAKQWLPFEGRRQTMVMTPW